MRFRNTSQYLTDEVRSLVEFSCNGVNMTGVAVHVKNARNCAYRGRAYDCVPCQSSQFGKETVKRLVTIGIGAPERFPTCNLVSTVVERFEVDPDEVKNLPEKYGVTLYYENGVPNRAVATARLMVPYGGKSSPLIKMNCWREALVAVAAHEARHIYQFRNHRPRSEVDAERWAAKRLAAFRAYRDGEIMKKGRSPGRRSAEVEI